MTSGKKQFSADDIRCISFEEQVLKNPRMYWGKLNPQDQDVVEAVTEQIDILGLSPVIEESFQGWVLVGAQQDWITSGLELGRTVEGLFKKGIGFPEKGGNSLRCEFFIYIFSESLCLWRENTLYELKSEAGEELQYKLKESYAGACLVAFKGNSYVKDTGEI